MAVVGKGFAVLQSGKFQLSGFVAWLAWAFVHLQFLARQSLRVSVFAQWIWTLIMGTRGARLIVNYHPASSTESTDLDRATAFAANLSDSKLETTIKTTANG